MAHKALQVTLFCYRKIYYIEILEIDKQDVLFKVGCSVNTVIREYNDDAIDLSVKVLGGSIAVQRLFYGNEWHWEHIRNNLQFNLDFLGQYVESIEKGGVLYKRKTPTPVYVNGQIILPTMLPVFVHDTYKITKLVTGYRWEDKLGNWKEYDINGRLTSYGNRSGLLANLIYESGDNGKLIGITDINDRQVVWFEYNSNGQISAVQDNADRRVEYSYTDARLTGVTDVLSNETTYEYDSDGRIIRSVDAGGRPTIATYDSYGNVASVIDRNGNGHFFNYDYDEVAQEYYAQIKTTSGMGETSLGF